MTFNDPPNPDFWVTILFTPTSNNSKLVKDRAVGYLVTMTDQ